MISAELAGRTILVTGGASGIGRATARLFARNRATVLVNDLPGNPQLDACVAELRADGLDAQPVPADAADPAGARGLVATAVARTGRLDYLFNNIGVGLTEAPIPVTDLDALPDDFWRRMLEANVLGPFACIHAAAPHLRTTRGAIVNNASTAGLGINQGSSMAYAASKAALISLTRSLARGLGPEVRVNAVAPGHIVTPRTDRLGPAHRQRSVSRTALQRAGTAEDVAEVVLFLCAGASYMTGQTLVVDGGMQ